MALDSPAGRVTVVRPLRYKIVETSSVTDEALESVVNHWVAQGWAFEGMQFAMRESSKRPAMAFVVFTRPDEPVPAAGSDDAAGCASRHPLPAGGSAPACPGARARLPARVLAAGAGPRHPRHRRPDALGRAAPLWGPAVRPGALPRQALRRAALHRAVDAASGRPGRLASAQ